MAKRKKARKSKKGATRLGRVKRSVKAYKPTSKPASKRKRARKAKGQVPLKVLESRAAYMVGLVERRGGTVRMSTRLTHRTPKQAGRLRAGKKRRRSRK